MKKLLIPFITLCVFASLRAQDDCMDFFPTTPGTVLVNKTYDANGSLLATMNYRINQSYDFQAGNEIQIGFVMTDAKDNVIDQGNLDAYCDDGSFYLKMTNRTLSPMVMDLLSTDTELVGDFLDYPDTFRDDFPFDGTFKMSDGEFTLRSKSNKKELVRVRVSNRKYEGNEKITTPAGTFNASKVLFDFEVTKDKQTTHYKGVEWYATNAGIVRSETRDNYNNPVNYTELTTLKDK